MVLSKQLTGLSLAPQSGKAKKMVIFLHGYGANGADLISIGEEWQKSLPDTVFLSPNAPEVCEMSPMGFQWFSIRSVDKKTLERDKQIEKVAPVLNDYIDAQLEKWGVDESNLIVAGFSQGAMMAMYTMPRRKKPCAGMIAWSGMLIDAAGLKKDPVVKMPLLAIHGDADDVVHPDSLSDVYTGFSEAGFDVETIMRPHVGHGIDMFSMTRSLQFIQEAFEK